MDYLSTQLRVLPTVCHNQKKGSVYFATKMPTATAWLELLIVPPVQSLAEKK